MAKCSLFQCTKCLSTARYCYNKPTAILILALSVSATRSTRKMAQGCGISLASMSKILSTNNFHHIVYILSHGDDTDRQMKFCDWVAQRWTQQPNLEANIIFGDEACFHLNGTVNKHNAGYLATENPYIALDAHHQTGPRLNVWCGIHENVLIGPIFLNNKLTAELYREHLEITLLLYMHDLPLEKRLGLFCEQDEAPLLFGLPTANCSMQFYLGIGPVEGVQ